jgi:hypothetical protein
VRRGGVGGWADERHSLTMYLRKCVEWGGGREKFTHYELNVCVCVYVCIMCVCVRARACLCADVCVCARACFRACVCA